MIINKIKINNFKSIYDELELDFNDMGGLWKISGSVGSGKTTIGEAIIFGLFGSIKGKNNGELISWGRKHGLIEMWCISKGNNIYIKRELNAYGMNPMYVEVNGDEIIFTNKRDAQSQLEQEYFDVSRMTIELLCIISFNNFKSLATLNTTDTKRFLDQVLGFQLLTQYSDSCKELRNLNRQNINELTLDIQRIQGQIDKIHEITNMAKIEGDINVVKTDISNYKAQYKDIVDRYTIETDKINIEITENKTKLASIKALGANKKKEIDFIEKGKCPTCGAPIDQSHLEIKKQERQLLLEQYMAVDQNIKSLNEKLITTKQQMNSETTPITNSIQELNDLYNRLIEQSRRQDINKSEITLLEKSIKEKEEEVLKYTQEDVQWEMLWNILSNDIRSKILESFIPLLNDNILKYSTRLQLPYLVQFDSSFKCNITLCNCDQPISLSSLSTGQLKTVDMIIILGVLGTVLGSEACNIMFLDELFSNLDVDLRNEMCGMLREFITPSQTLFIISHMDIDDRYFDGSINMKLELRNQYEKHSMISLVKNDKKEF